ncbi:MAG: hypothetical protein O2857_21130 [Planctomycetota bacterium]|nr:hypothetical protein [Planctomycetota bacterium]
MANVSGNALACAVAAAAECRRQEGMMQTTQGSRREITDRQYRVYTYQSADYPEQLREGDTA